MTNQSSEVAGFDKFENDELIEPIRFRFALDRRTFVQTLGAGVLVTAIGIPATGQPASNSGRGRGRSRGRFFGGGPVALSARFHFGDDGSIRVFSGKVDAGQGARCELAQAAAEELRVSVDRIEMVLGDTSDCPNDGTTAGSGTTPRTVPAVRRAAAALRDLLIDSAAEQWQVEPNTIEVRDGKIAHGPTNRTTTYAEAMKAKALADPLNMPASPDAATAPISKWKSLGVDARSPAARAKVLGKHEYPTDIRRPGMLYGRVLRSPKYRAKLKSIDLGPAKAMDGVLAVQDGEFVGVVAPTAFGAKRAIEAVAIAAEWREENTPSSNELFAYLREHAGKLPFNPNADSVQNSKKSLRANYSIAYVQHAPLEPRTAVAEWNNGKLTVWTATQNPFGVKGELARAFHLDDSAVRVIVPDFGSGYGGKHTGEAAIEAARLAQAAKKPVMLRWTREEEFANAYFRPAAVIDVEASLDESGKLTTWYHLNINAGGNAIETPYSVPRRFSDSRGGSRGADTVLRHGSYRALAATGNTFARESFMDEMAALAGADPLDFRLAHLEESRLRAVLEDAAKRFKWRERVKRKQSGRGVGLACGTEKGSFVACCAEVEIDQERKEIRVHDVCQVFDCGPAVNPENLRNQMEGAIVMGLGPALREAVLIEDGAIASVSFRQYRVPRMADVPAIEVHAMNRNDVEPAGAGETPIIGIAPAIGNAVFHAIGLRLRSMPMQLA